jgi:hypothetical protein
MINQKILTLFKVEGRKMALFVSNFSTRMTWFFKSNSIVSIITSPKVKLRTAALVECGRIIMNTISKLIEKPIVDSVSTIGISAISKIRSKANVIIHLDLGIETLLKLKQKAHSLFIHYFRISANPLVGHFKKLAVHDPIFLENLDSLTLDQMDRYVE